ncbi:MAG: transporter substrate-binding domain-containing protein [Campylobacteraceae bacterium]|nr:transporter substrate-binding domain-containing protein [Campylobacteraceae bacterium]
MRKMLINSILIVMFLGFIFASFAQNSSLTVLSTPDFPPFNYEKNGKMVGVDIDVAHEIGKRINVEIIMKYVPWKRLLKTLE